MAYLAKTPRPQEAKAGTALLGFLESWRDLAGSTGFGGAGVARFFTGLV